MDEMTLLALSLAVVWGGVWAAFLQFTQMGRFLAVQRTWITVVVGVGGDLALMALCVPFEVWLRVAGIVALSGMGIITRSLINEWSEMQELGTALRGEDTSGE